MKNFRKERLKRQEKTVEFFRNVKDVLPRHSRSSILLEDHRTLLYCSYSYFEIEILKSHLNKGTRFYLKVKTRNGITIDACPGLKNRYSISKKAKLVEILFNVLNYKPITEEIEVTSQD